MLNSRLEARLFDKSAHALLGPFFQLGSRRLLQIPGPAVLSGELFQPGVGGDIICRVLLGLADVSLGRREAA